MCWTNRIMIRTKIGAIIFWWHTNNTDQSFCPWALAHKRRQGKKIMSTCFSCRKRQQPVQHCCLNNNAELQKNLKILNNHQFAIESNFEDNRATHSECAMDAEIRFPEYCLLFLATWSDRIFFCNLVLLSNSLCKFLNISLLWLYLDMFHKLFHHMLLQRGICQQMLSNKCINIAISILILFSQEFLFWIISSSHHHQSGAWVLKAFGSKIDHWSGGWPGTLLRSMVE